MKNQPVEAASPAFALCPFISMANRVCSKPNAQIKEINPLDPDRPENGFVSLVARRAIREGEEITIEEDFERTNEAIWEKYGFRMPGASEN